jgi:hypothetical protein
MLDDEGYEQTDKNCEYLFPEDHQKAGQRCQGFKVENSDFCYFHSDQQKVIDDLDHARDIKAQQNKETVKDTMAILDLTCDKCTLTGACDFYDTEYRGKCKRVDWKTGDVLGDIRDIASYTERLTDIDSKNIAKLQVLIELNPEKASLLEQSSKMISRHITILRNYAQIKKLYQETEKKPKGWADILSKDFMKDDWK